MLSGKEWKTTFLRGEILNSFSVFRKHHASPLVTINSEKFGSESIGAHLLVTLLCWTRNGFSVVQTSHYSLEDQDFQMRCAMLFFRNSTCIVYQTLLFFLKSLNLYVNTWKKKTYFFVLLDKNYIIFCSHSSWNSWMQVWNVCFQNFFFILY